ncbi:GAF domain-containing sensor histidine kinase [Nostoc sp. FACHB-152]|uniref:GAF domain-containing sensor histidine kinase n=1 Tax=unclassified Nostoc TaxID=2593658 RepID=UPI00168204E2|nr:MULTISPECIES: GAF domain-containing sensor histidine kinase [unclassified Nostoc]MBD2447539.1 GAF domain-containing sensor histidine kinase [Nostoc sp. FACHB-152]MBD2469309.1 GAF domain-containing sensor histidine kinase [Nostoc sp. FACHB-145]
MLSSPDLSFSRSLPLVVFNQLGKLLQQMAQSVESSVLVLTEALLARIIIPEEWQGQRFTLVVSEQFSALLLGTCEQGSRGAEAQRSRGAVEELNTSLTFSSEAIASFVGKLKDLFASNSDTYQNLEYYSQILRPNDATLQSQFTLLLLEYLLPHKNEQATEALIANQGENFCQAIEIALQKQISQERLLNQVTTQIRKSLDLPLIMATAIAQVRDFLKLDRLVIYKFESARVNTQNSTLKAQNSSQPPIQDWQKYGGCIVYEAKATDAIPSVLHSQEANCFTRHSVCWDKYRQGFTLVVEDVEKTYALEECLLNFLRANRVRAKLAAPIMFEEKLWGLLIAHQCDVPRQWNENDSNLLTAIAEQLAIAIHQSELMRSLTQEKQTLEQRVLERTMALRDALLAAEAASRLRNEFLATISHELLTPLTYVIGMSSTLLRWPIGELSQRQRDYLQTIHDSGEHLLEMINDILDLSQIEAGKTVLNISEFSLAHIGENAISALIDKATEQQVNLKLDLQIDPKRDRFSADAERIEQILWNLLTNAIKFTPEGGSVTLRLWVEEDTAIFQVEDTGIGISEEQLPVMFEKFQQLDTPYRRRYEGTGLGLALTKQLVELHRGRIEVESTVGIGSIFTVWIPAQSIKVLSEE